MSLKARLCPKMEGLRKAKKEGQGSRRDVVIEGGLTWKQQHDKGINIFKKFKSLKFFPFS
jgi:hypothetical protein